MTTTRSGLCTDPPPTPTVDCNEMTGCIAQSQVAPIPEMQQISKTEERLILESQPTIVMENSASQGEAQNQKQGNGDFTIIRAGRAKRRNVLDPSGTTKVYPEYTTQDLQNMEDIHIREFVNETISEARCPSCKRRGKLSPIEQPESRQTQLRFWICGNTTKPGGCRRIFAQSKVLGQCLQAGRKYAREIVFPHELTVRLSAIVISLKEPEKMEVVAAAGITPSPTKTQKRSERDSPARSPQNKVPQPRVPQARSSSQMQVSAPQSKGSISEEERVRFGRMCDEALSIIKDPASSRDAIKAAAGVLEFLRPYMFGESTSFSKKRTETVSEVAQPQSMTYAATARKNMPASPPKPRYPPAIERISKVRDQDERIEVGFRAITRQKKAPISRRVIKTNNIENPILRDQVVGTKFLYIKGIVRQPIRNIKKTFDQAGIDVKSIYDISFIGKTICAILCKAEYYDIIVDIVNRSRSGAKVLEDFDPLKPGVFRPELLQAESHKSPVEFLIRRAAYSAVATNNMVVTTAFQAIIPEHYHQKYREEIAVIEMECGNRQRHRVSGA